MKTKQFIIALSLLVSSVFAANNPSIKVTNISDKDSIALSVDINGVDSVKDVKFNGLDSIQIVGREISFKSSSTSESANLFQSKLYLMPTKAESATNVYVTANLDGKEVKSNAITLSISQQQLDAVKAKQKKQQELANKHMEEMQKQINEQIKSQQQFFDNINQMMLKQQQEMLKQQKELMESFK